MAVMPMPMPRSLILLLLLAKPFFLLPQPTSASTSLPDIDLIQNDSPQEDPEPEVVNKAHVGVLAAANFSSFLVVCRHVVVDFYAPWCYWSRKLAPEYMAAASHLADRGLDVALAKVDATQDRDLVHAHGVDGYPTVHFFIDNVPRRYPYYDEQTKDAMVTWISQRLSPDMQKVTTIDEAENIIIGGSGVAVLAFLDSLSVCSNPSKVYHPTELLLPNCYRVHWEGPKIDYSYQQML